MNLLNSAAQLHERVARWLRRNIGLHPRRFFERVRNLWRWFPIIWNDHDWDDYYMLVILRFKLKTMADFFASDYAMKEHHMRDANRIRLCVRLLDKLMDDKYNEEHFDYQTLGTMEKPFTIEKLRKSLEIVESRFEDYFAKYPTWHRRALADTTFQWTGERGDWHIAITLGHLRHEKAKELLFRIIRDNYERWWD